MQRNSWLANILEIKMQNTIKSSLSKEEIKNGWHFCPDWDNILIGPGMTEMNYCICDINKSFHNKIYKEPLLEELLSIKDKSNKI